MLKKGLARRGGFTLVELMIVIAIITILSGAAYIGIQRSQARGMNQRMADDLNAIVSALEQYKQDKGHYPNMEATEGAIELGEDKNVLCFNDDTTYAHDCATAEFIQTQVDNNLLTKRYLQEVPTDPRTSSRYIYGVTVDGQYFQVAGNYLNEEDGTYTAKVVGNLGKGYEMSSLIRAFDGPNFVVDGEGYLPYSPDHLAITARLEEVTGGAVTVDGISASAGTVIKAGSRIKTTPGTTAILYFSDGSITYLDGTEDPQGADLWVLPNTEVQKNDKDGIITKIRLKIFSGKIWNKVARLAKESEFNVETTSAIAGVRGTEFGISADPLNPAITVYSGSVAARRKNANETASIGTQDYLDFSGIDNTTITNTQVASGDNAHFLQFSLPTDSESNMPSTGMLLSSTEFEKYYRPSFNNNMRPRILKIDTTTLLPVIEFRLPNPDNLEKIFAYSATDKDQSVALWDADSDNKFTKTIDKVTISPGLMPNYSGNEPNLVVFRFADRHGNLSAFSDPAVEVKKNLTLTENEIYNMMAEEEGGQAANAPMIIGILPTMGMLSPGVNLSCDKPACDWSFSDNLGYWGGTNTNVSNVNYRPMDPYLDMDGKIAFVSNYFGDKNKVQVKITCTETSNPSNKTEKFIDITYEPFKISSLSGYQYSWFAQGSANWYVAKATCGGWAALSAPEQSEFQSAGLIPSEYSGLKEGGLTGWHLPEKGVYDLLVGGTNDGKTDANEGKLNWCGVWAGNHCPEMPIPVPPGIASIWLAEENPDIPGEAHIMRGWDLVNISSDVKTNLPSSRGFRCVRK